MSDDPFAYGDELGPKAIQYLYQPETGLKAILVVDNVAAGPAIGGARMAPDVTLEECFRLARSMTLKNAAAGLPHGGAKSVIFADPAMPADRKENLMRAFANAIGPVQDYIVGPDMGLTETCMAWVYDEIGRCVGLPRELGGIPLDQIGATGLGVVVSAQVAGHQIDLELAGARVAIQGFGAVGGHAARFFVDGGAIVVAAADSSGTVCDPDGLDVARLRACKAQGGHLTDMDIADKRAREAVVTADCDILVPAARPDAVRADNEAAVKARLIVQGANIGVTADAEQRLHQRGVLCVPDFISNAGGVICASVEYHGGTEGQAVTTIEEQVRANTAAVLHSARQADILPRAAAVRMAQERVQSAMSVRRW